MNELNCTIEWPDTKQIEEGLVIDANNEQVLFKSEFDGTINWIPRKYIKKLG